MIFEILGSRIIAPYTGNSIYVWTSIISVVLWALALGFYYWGRLSDKWADIHTLGKLFLWAGVCFITLPILKDPILGIIASNISWVQLSSIVASIILFTPMSFVLWAVSPIATKIHLTDMKSSGKVIGQIWSIGTLGSIIGTLLAWFVLIPQFWVIWLLIILAICSFVLSLICSPKRNITWFIIGLFLCLWTWAYKVWIHDALSSKWIHVIDTAYSHVTVQDLSQDGRPARKLFIDNITHAGMFLDGNDLVHEYTKLYDLFDVFLPEAKDVLMFGGAAYWYPKHFLETYPDRNIDVVEIDPEITDIAKKYFNLVENPRLDIHNWDARRFLEQNEKQYDAILWDAFGSYFSIPYQLTTLETVQKKYDSLSDNWVVILNIIASLEWPKAKFLEAEYLTYEQVFPEVFIIPVRNALPHTAQNIILIALKDPSQVNTRSNNPFLQEYLSHKKYLDIPEWTKILTDNYAPVDSYISELTK